MAVSVANYQSIFVLRERPKRIAGKFIFVSINKTKIIKIKIHGNQLL